MTSTTVHAVASWLKSKFVLVPHDWIGACLEWMASENQDLSNVAAIKKMVYEQWLLTDLRDIGQPILPPEIAEIKYTLKGTYCVQVDSVLDISQPKYSQLMQLQKKDSVNTFVTAETQVTQKPWEVKSSRILMLSITDGVQSISAMEYTAIPALSDKIPPGLKIMIRGPVMCRRGVILLKPANIDILGGEVEDLFAENNYEAALCKGLNKPIMNVLRQKHSSTTQRTVTKQEEDDVELDRLLADVDFDCSKDITTSQNQSFKRERSTPQTDFITISDDEAMDHLLANADLDDLVENRVPSQCREPTESNNKIPSNSSINAVFERFDQPIRVQNTDENYQLPTKRQKECDQRSLISTKKILDKVAMKNQATHIGHSKKIVQRECKIESGVQAWKDPACNTDLGKLTLHKYSQKSSVKPTENDQIYLCHVRDLLKSHCNDKLNICIKAIVITLLSKLKPDTVNGWGLEARICDGTGLLDVQFSNSVLESLIGFTVGEAELVKQSSDECQRDKLKEGLDKCRETIITMCHHMNIEVRTVSNTYAEGFIKSVVF